jgi:hypothetical protein
VKLRIIAAVVERFVLYQASWEHCKVEDTCCCGETFFGNTRRAGSIVMSRMIASVVGHFFLILG